MAVASVDPQSVFVSEIERLVTVDGLGLVEAVLHWCETRSLEVDYAAGLVKKNKTLKRLLREEALRLHMLKQEVKC